MGKKRSLNEYRQSKEFGYKPPLTKEQSEHKDEVNSVRMVLKHAEEHGMTFEIVYSALQNMKKNPKLSIVESLSNACFDWDI